MMSCIYGLCHSLAMHKETRHYDVAVHLPVSQKAKGNTNICQK